MINVAQVVEDLKIGGLERVIENITIHLDSEKFRVFVLCLTRGGEIAERLIANGKDVEILGIKNYHNPLSLIKVVKWLRQEKIDIVHTHAYPAGVLGRAAAIVARVPCIIHHVHSIHSYNRRQLLIERLLSGFTDKIISCSNAVRGFMIRTAKVKEDKTITIYNGVPLSWLSNNRDASDIRKVFNIPENSPVVGTVGRLHAIKGHKYLLEAAVTIQKTMGDVHFLIVGDGLLRKELEDMSRRLKLSNVIFTGRRTDVNKLLTAMDIFVLLSVSEGLGIVIIEAMAAGLPVVATKIGGISEIVSNGISGILVPPEDPDAIANAIIMLLNDKEMAKRMGATGRGIYEQQFTSELMVKSIEEVYGAFIT